MTTLDIILRILTIIALILQILAIIYLLYINHKRDKEDKQFWKMINESTEKSIKKYNLLYPDEPLELEEFEKDE